MSDTEIPNCKCGAFLLIDSQHVIFKGGRLARIKCDECNANRLIKWDLVKHLKDDSQEEEAEGLKIEPEEPPEESNPLLDALKDESPEKEAEGLKQNQEEGSGAGWALAAVTGLAGLFLLASGKKRG